MILNIPEGASKVEITGSDGNVVVSFDYTKQIPEIGSKFYYIGYNYERGFIVFDMTWHDSDLCNGMLKTGNVFNSENKADNMAYEFNRLIKKI